MPHQLPLGPWTCVSKNLRPTCLRSVMASAPISSSCPLGLGNSIMIFMPSIRYFGWGAPVRSSADLVEQALSTMRSLDWGLRDRTASLYLESSCSRALLVRALHVCRLTGQINQCSGQTGPTACHAGDEVVTNGGTCLMRRSSMAWQLLLSSVVPASPGLSAAWRCGN